MSRMSDLSQEIQHMLEDGIAPQEIANALDIPVSWIYEELSPFETINS